MIEIVLFILSSKGVIVWIVFESNLNLIEWNLNYKIEFTVKNQTTPTELSYIIK